MWLSGGTTPADTSLGWRCRVMETERWVVRDARGVAFWWGDATSEDEALMLAERAQAGAFDPPGPWDAVVLS